MNKSLEQLAAEAEALLKTIRKRNERARAELAATRDEITVIRKRIERIEQADRLHRAWQSMSTDEAPLTLH